MIAERRDLCPRAPSDREAVLAALRRYRAVCSLDLRERHYSGNPSQRVRELRERGFVIEAEPTRRDGRNATLYRLLEEPDLRVGAATVPTSNPVSPPHGGDASPPVTGGPDPGAGLFDAGEFDPEPVTVSAITGARVR